MPDQRSAPILFIHGSDADYVDSVVADTLTRLQAKHGAGLTLKRCDGEALRAEPAILLDHFATSSLFGETPLLVATRLTEKNASILEAFFDQPPPEALDGAPALLLSSHSLKAKSAVLARAKAAGCQMIKAYAEPATAQSLRDALTAAGVPTVDRDAVTALHAFAADLPPAEVSQTIALLALYAENGSLSVNDFEAALGGRVGASGGEVIEPLLAGDVGRLLLWFRGALDTGADPVGLLAQLGRVLSDASGRGGRPTFWRTSKVIEAAQRRIPDFSRRIDLSIQDLQRLERAARSSSPLVREQSERLLLRLAQRFAR